MPVGRCNNGSEPSGDSGMVERISIRELTSER